MGKIDINNWRETLYSKPREEGVTLYSNSDDWGFNLTDEQVRESNRYHQYSTTDYFGDIWYDGITMQFYNQIMRPQNVSTITIIEGNTIKEVVELAKESLDNMMKIVLKPRAENYSIDELESMETINSRLYFQIRDYVINNRDRPLFLIGGRGFGKTFNVLKAITKPKYIGRKRCAIRYKHSVPIQEKDWEEWDFIKNEVKRKKQLKQSLKSPTVFIFKKNEKQEIWKPIEGKYIKSADLNEVFNTSSIIVFDDIHYICENVINKNLSVDVLITLLRNILKTSKLKIPVIMISDEMISRYAGQINNDEIDELVLMFGEVSFRKMHELPKIELRDYLKKRDYLVKLELPPITYEEFDSLFNLSNIYADDFVKKFLYDNSNGNPRGFARFVSSFNSKEITIDNLIQIAKKRLLNHKKYSQYLQAMKFPILPVAINDVFLSKAIARFKTFKKFYIFSQKTYDFKQELYEKIDSNYKKAYALFEEQNDEHMLSKIAELSQMKKNSKYPQGYKQLIKIIKKDFNDVFEQIPEIAKITRWGATCNKYISTCDSLVELKEELEMNDADFEKFWKIIPGNYSNGNVYKPFLLAFNKELSEGWYLDKTRFEL